MLEIEIDKVVASKYYQFYTIKNFGAARKWAAMCMHKSTTWSRRSFCQALQLGAKKNKTAHIDREIKKENSFRGRKGGRTERRD